MRKWLFKPASPDDLITILRSWRFWLLSALAGMLIGWLVFRIFPGSYQAVAEVVVDQNLEQAVPQALSDRERFTYLERETQKLEALVLADITLAPLTEQFPDLDAAELRSRYLVLSHPSDGAWHLWARHRDPEVARQLAAAWAQSFVGNARQGVAVSIELEGTRRAMELGICPSEMSEMRQTIQDLETASYGLSPYLEVSLSQADGLQVQPAPGLAIHLLVGALTAWLLALLAILFVGPRDA